MPAVDRALVAPRCAMEDARSAIRLALAAVLKALLPSSATLGLLDAAASGLPPGDLGRCRLGDDPALAGCSESPAGASHGGFGGAVASAASAARAAR
mmetsp:Transcript_90189/g.280136  ORF Transcript_90189/g.280136 Transcript_90189/m.280136 type:complete len:97 (-) Transcript_90189:185-475(-)